MSLIEINIVIYNKSKEKKKYYNYNKKGYFANKYY